ncbi:class I SAM-dependent methyltransferase [Nocardia terpenica]|uniref:class I SAM-dependent methyltransferase n=1 Tax=Nocardia terpenica TaxID=455432 RepID=UPI00189400EC|nr:class I SAM-dependent methyltransferase [Nocardia terpenica]MBF6065642.1 class I SAM-dependent methyltransferase [Nocardia terpenica]MBF6108320.1 class I SAM-dependent methyltransferase [Nocardia terpenica]MBF6115757.1 class I SAM-dependent methyltransferase [Nocardia terpenica]MBF6122887.1 class I SAM-dependent methyltransferase [Nocardia terpenica]MBF6156040.1 class I SAM-dependent methyltransferase [Nocardia terpenica]
MQASPIPGEYVFDNSDHLAAEQLRLLGEILDEHTIRAMLDAGVREGWRCWDIGAGGGSIASWLAATVGPTGTVLATDLQPQHVRPSPGIEIRAHDIRIDENPGTFDLIHARLVLMHLPDRESIVAKLSAALAPGGVLIVSDWDGMEPDFILFSPDPETTDILGKFRDTAMVLAESAGMDFSWARRAGRAFDAAGLTDIGTRGSCESWVGGAHIRASVTRPDLMVWSYQLYTTTGRRP